MPETNLLPTPRIKLTLQEEQARAFAMTHHKEQMYGTEPYVFHLDAVAEILKPYGEESVILGYLHDIIEDTPIQEEELAQTFGSHVAKSVDYLSDPPQKSRRERKQESHRKLASIGENSPYTLALLVKTADRLANMRQSTADQNMPMLRMYTNEYKEFKKAVYREGMASELWEELDQLAHQLGD